MKALTQLVIASHNKGKVAEIGAMIAPLGISVLSAAEAGVDEPEETGSTFAANAEIKARNAVRASGKASLADDSGLVIPALGGAPGVYSARWAGPKKDFSVAFARIQKELASKFPSPQRGEAGRGASNERSRVQRPHPNPPPTGEGIEAHFTCALALALPDGVVHHFEGICEGHLNFPPRGDLGFGYDPIFIPLGYDITFGEIAPEEKNRISHRAKAFALFVDFLKNRI